MKPILFNTEMVRAILDGRKTVTRRVIKPQPAEEPPMYCYAGSCNRDIGRWHSGGQWWTHPCQVGDVLYVRETWSPVHVRPKRFLYKTQCAEAEGLPINWHPSIHMPKEAARIFLRVTGVRVEKLQEIDKYWDSYDKEGVRNPKFENISIAMQEKFISIWNSTIKPADLPQYGWESDPWVWVIEFERIERP